MSRILNDNSNNLNVLFSIEDDNNISSKYVKYNSNGGRLIHDCSYDFINDISSFAGTIENHKGYNYMLLKSYSQDTSSEIQLIQDNSNQLIDNIERKSVDGNFKSNGKFPINLDNIFRFLIDRFGYVYTLGYNKDISGLEIFKHDRYYPNMPKRKIQTIRNDVSYDNIKATDLQLDNDNNLILTGINYGNMYGNELDADVIEERFLTKIINADIVYSFDNTGTNIFYLDNSVKEQDISMNINLISKPEQPVYLNIVSSKNVYEENFTITPNEISFNEDNWDISQTITIKLNDKYYIRGDEDIVLN